MRDRIVELLNHPSLKLPKDTDFRQVTEQIQVFLAEWRKWNRKINLTSETEDQAVLEKHIFDSLQYSCALGPDGGLMDIGSGAGFPGIPLKLVFPRLFVVLVESQRKRASFLQNAVREMQLESVEVLHGRAEELGGSYKHRFDDVVFRSVGKLSQCLKIAAPFLRSKGRVINRKEPGAPRPGGGPEEPSPLELRTEIPVTNIKGIRSKLMVFEECSTWNNSG